MTTKRKLIGRLVPCRCFRGEEEVISVLDYSHCSLQQVPKEIFSFERTLEELYLDANQIEELPKVTLDHMLTPFCCNCNLSTDSNLQAFLHYFTFQVLLLDITWNHVSDLCRIGERNPGFVVALHLVIHIFH